MKKIINWVTDHPVIAAFILGVIVLVFTVKVGTIEVDSSAEGLMVEKDPARDYYEQVKDKFGSDALTVVAVKSDEIFTRDVLKVVKGLTNKFRNLEGVSRVESLTTVNKIKGEDDFLNTDKLISYIPDSQAELRNIKEDTFSNYIFVNNLISKDSKVTAINIYTEAPKGDKDFNGRVSQKIDEIIAPYQDKFDIYQLGGPLTKVTFSSYIQNDQTTLIPLAVVILVIILVITFRSTIGVVVPLITSGLSILCTVGFMTYMKYPINVITAIVPALLIAVGSTEDVHMISEYFVELRQGKKKKDAIKAMGARCGLPILLTSSTTFLGFMALSINKITILKQFGIVSAFGLIVNFLVTIIAVPVILRIFGTPKIFKGRRKDGKKPGVGLMDAFLDKIAQINLNKRPLIAFITVIFMALAVWGCFKIKVNTDFISYFKEGSFVRKRCDNLHKDLSGAMNFYITTETGESDKAKTPHVLKQIADLQRYLRQTKYFDKVISITDHIMIMSREMQGGNKAYQVIPDSEALIAQYLLLMDESEITRYLDNDYSTINVVIRHNVTSSWELNKVLRQIRAYIDENFSEDLKVSFTGEGILINNAADAMAKGQVGSLSMAMGAIFIIMAFLFLSVKVGLLSMIPNIVPIFLSFGLMGWCKIPLNTGTCMVAAIALGIAVDDTIHFMTRYNRELNDTNDQNQAMYNTVKGEGRPVVSTSIALALGFGILMCSNFNPTINFGFLAVFVMIVALLSDLFVTPSLLISVRLITLWDVVTTKINKQITEFSPLFKGLKRGEAKKVVILGGLKSFPKGSLIIKQGGLGRELYMVVLGKLKVYVDKEGKEVELAKLSEGDIVGEMAAVSGEARSANVMALEDTELLLIDEHSLNRIGKRIPKTAAKLFLNMSKILSQRLRQTDKGIV
jgi:predicted RND superfamily exporter protein